LVRVVDAIERVTPHEQQGKPTAADKLSVDEFRLDPTRPARELARVVRAGNPRPGAWLTVDGLRIKVLRSHVVDGARAQPGTIDVGARLGTADGLLALDEVQPAGKRPMTGTAWRAGVRGGDPQIEPGVDS
jgi:methionyl-tRNA formyltransferase